MLGAAFGDSATLVHLILFSLREEEEEEDIYIYSIYIWCTSVQV